MCLWANLCLFTDSHAKLPKWFLTTQWDRTIRYHTISLWADNNLGLEQREEDGRILHISSPERAIMECLNRPFIAQTLMDTYYIMEMLTTLRPKLVQQLLEQYPSIAGDHDLFRKRFAADRGGV